MYKHLFTFFLLLGIIAIAGLGQAQSFTVEPAPEWDTLFDRNYGWTGADGIYSIPLNQDERPGSYQRTGTFLVFSDTFIGFVYPDGHRDSRTVLVNNTACYLQPGGPNPARAHFFFAQDSAGRPEAMFIPNTPNSRPNEWYWMKDGIALNGTVYLLASRFRLDWYCLIYREGVAMIEIPPGSQPPFDDHIQREVPLDIPPTNCDSAVVFGACIMPNTVTAGVPFPDGYIYIYGTREEINPGDKKVLVARVAEADFPDIAQWRFYDGSGWVPEIESAAEITDRASMELSVTPLPNGQFVLVFQIDQVGRKIGLRVGDAPWGPFGNIVQVYECPEPEMLPGIIVYNAKAHPHLSSAGELLVSYNVNTINGDDHYRYADIYRPRFIRIVLNDFEVLPGASIKAGESSRNLAWTFDKAEESVGIPSGFTLLGNCPNPFNAETVISYQLPATNDVKLEIYNLLGEKVVTLVDGEQEAGYKSITWDASEVSSGVYFCKLTAADFTEVKRMTLLR